MRIPIIAALLAQLISPVPKPGHATITPSPAEVDGKAGAKVSLVVDVQPKPGVHVYAPGAGEFYIPITVKLNPQNRAQARQVGYPKSKR
jgi:DsbC/DsbD-like thiol-disulfide interchange protein